MLSTAFELGLVEAFGVERGKVRTAEELAEELAVQMGAEKLLLGKWAIGAAEKSLSPEFGQSLRILWFDSGLMVSG